MVTIDKKKKKEIVDSNATNSNDSTKNSQFFRKNPFASNLSLTLGKDYLPIKSSNRLYKHQDNKTPDPEIFYLPRLLLPRNVLGMYVPSDNQIFLASDRFPYEMTDTASHEASHGYYKINSEDITHTHATGHINVRPQRIEDIEKSYRNRHNNFSLSA